MGTRGQGHRDACVGTWDLGASDEGLEDKSMGHGDVWDIKNRDVGNAGCE